MKTKIILILLLLITGALHAQTNLVPNGGFEEYAECPGGSPGNQDIHLAEPWAGFSADYIHSCANEDPNYSDEPGSYSSPRSGEGYARIACYAADVYNIREYIEVQLIESLEVGERYCVEYYCRLYDVWGIGVNGMGAHFTEEYMWYDHGSGTEITVTPQIVSETIHSDIENYTQVLESFIAQRAFNYVAIGNFLDDEDLKKEIVLDPLPDWGGGASYAIDDIAVYKCPLSLEEQTQLPKTYPAVGQLHIKHLQEPVRVDIYDVNGRKVASQSFEDDSIYELSFLPTGLYIYRLSGKNNIAESGKIMVP